MQSMKPQTVTTGRGLPDLIDKNFKKAESFPDLYDSDRLLASSKSMNLKKFTLSTKNTIPLEQNAYSGIRKKLMNGMPTGATTTHQ